MKSIDPGVTGRARDDRDHPTEDQIQQLADEYGIELGRAYRPKDAYPILGWGHSQTAVKVAAGEIEAPIPLSESGSAVAWTGRQLVKIIWKRLQLAAKKKQQVALAETRPP